MARKDEPKNKSAEASRNKVQGFVFGINLEGTEDVVIEGIKAFTQALSKTGMVVASVPFSKPSSQVAHLQSPQHEAPIEDSPVNVDEFEDEEAEQEAETEQGTKRTTAARRTYNHKPPEFLNDLDLTKANKSILDFVAEKGNPTETNDRYIVIAVWLKEYMQVDEFTINHIYTVYNNLGWKAQLPVNHSQPIRDLKSKRHFLTREDGHDYKVNWQGIQYVAKMGSGS